MAVFLCYNVSNIYSLSHFVPRGCEGWPCCLSICHYIFKSPLYIYVHLCTTMYMYTYVHLCTPLYNYVYVHICTSLYNYVQLCICTHVYICVHLCTSLYNYVYVHICTSMYTSVHLGIPLYTHVHLCTPLFVAVHTCTPLYTSVHLCTSLYVAVHLCTPLYISVHLCVYLYISVHLWFCYMCFIMLHEFSVDSYECFIPTSSCWLCSCRVRTSGTRLTGRPSSTPRTSSKSPLSSSQWETTAGRTHSWGVPLAHKRSAPVSLLASRVFEHYVVSYFFVG